MSDSQPTNGSDKSHKIENRAPFVAPNSTWEQGSVKEKQAAVSSLKMIVKELVLISGSIFTDSKVSQQQDGDKHEAGTG